MQVFLLSRARGDHLGLFASDGKSAAGGGFDAAASEEAKADDAETAVCNGSGELESTTSEGATFGGVVDGLDSAFALNLV